MWPTTPFADFCTAVREPCGSLSPERTRCRSPGVSPTAFLAHPPDLQFWPLMDMDFATSCPLVRPMLPRIRFLFVGSRFRSTLPSDSPSRFRPCASLVLHLHQVAQGTFTPRLLDMPSTQTASRRYRDGCYAASLDRRCARRATAEEGRDGETAPQPNKETKLPVHRTGRGRPLSVVGADRTTSVGVEGHRPGQEVCPQRPAGRGRANGHVDEALRTWLGTSYQ